MLSRFSNQVLSRGPAAVLPQNLSADWLKALQKRCDTFLDRNFAVDQCSESPDADDPVLVACVHEVLRHTRKPDRDPSAEDLTEGVTIYALSITMETIRREADLEMAPPTLEDLLSIDRIVRFGRINPEFGRFLQRACITPDEKSTTEKSWLSRLKQRILSRIDEN